MFLTSNFLTSNYEIVLLYFALMTSLTVMALNIPRIKSKAKTITEGVLLLISFLVMAGIMFLSEAGVVGIIFMFFILPAVVVTCFLKCRTYLGKYSLKEAIKNPNILPFICTALLYAVLIVIAFFGIALIAIITESTIR